MKKENLKKGLLEFKEFISKGNVIDMAVGVIIGAAFGKIVSSLVNDILMPVIGGLLGGLNFSMLSIDIGSSKIMYGQFIQSIVDFLIIAACIFVIIKLIEKLKKNDKAEEVAAPVVKSEDVKLLEEIRDLLKKKNK